MSKVAATKTRSTCDRVAIRANLTRRHRYASGMYYVRTSTIGLRFMPRLAQEHPRHEDEICRTLLHEVTHWAQYLFLDRAQWPTRSMLRDIPPSVRVVERMAEEMAQTWVSEPKGGD